MYAAFAEESLTQASVQTPNQQWMTDPSSPELHTHSAVLRTGSLIKYAKQDIYW